MLKALTLIFAEPDAAAKRYKRKAATLLLVAIMIAILAGLAGRQEATRNVSVAMMLLSGILIGRGASYLGSSREAHILSQYCTFKKP